MTSASAATPVSSAGKPHPGAHCSAAAPRAGDSIAPTVYDSTRTAVASTSAVPSWRWPISVIASVYGTPPVAMQRDGVPAKAPGAAPPGLPPAHACVTPPSTRGHVAPVA
ncbi:MAG: hypothetical protein HXY24_09840 [Rubrivivax sp.]|nr:hypothetical protein [Rubrivivax sp.]